jgi:hypothetical protein
MSAEYQENDADLWLNLRSRLQHGLEQATHLLDSFPCPVDLALPDDAAFQRWSMACVKAQHPVNDVIDHWLRTGRLEEHHGPYRWYLHQRFLIAWRLVRQFAFSRHHTTEPEWVCIFPFPGHSPDEVLAFLLKDWWQGTGCHIAFESLHRPPASPKDA